MSLADKLDLLTGNSLCVIGDCICDSYTTVDIRLCHNEPAPITYRVMREVPVPGGAANVANNLATLKNNVTLMGVLGYGETGDVLRNVILERKINFMPYVDSYRSTIKKIRFLKDKQTTPLPRIDYEFPRDTAPIPQEIEVKIIDDLEKNNPNVIVLPDYAKGMFNGGLAQRIMEYAKRANAKVFATPKPKNAEKFKGAYMIGLNRDEAEEIYTKLTGKVVADFTGEEVHNAIAYHLDARHVVITYGEEGMFSKDNDEGYIHELPKVKREVADTVGAGDTTLAVIALALSRGLSVREALILANCAAGVVIEKRGTATVSIEELREHLNHFSL